MIKQLLLCIHCEAITIVAYDNIQEIEKNILEFTAFAFEYRQGVICKQSRKVQLFRTQILDDRRSFLVANNRELYTSKLQIYTTSSHKTSCMNGFVAQNGFKKMLQGNDYKSIDMIFLFLPAFLPER